MYRLRRTMRFLDKRTGLAFDGIDIDAETWEEAIAQAMAFDPITPSMMLDTAVLTDATGTVIWTLRAPPSGRLTQLP
ncbi:hypothetical protein MKK84_03030 [Methylobacterium sp. E-065]|uniref:hypothetical protein n=1 Tax=Methylobacterium sp. E-065 TaxID=2836583 RepID=UPI001FB95280|nr:hypothetical protein [Methylobacterium sp. E-065]MCJ2016411.1 hypothetical protein [Methylobacterium sp. E-065]